MTLFTLQQQWIDQFTVWAESRDDVRAALVVGSHGRTNDYPADEWSDVIVRDDGFVSLAGCRDG